MQTTINRINEVEYELEVNATAEELAPELQKALRAQRGRTAMKGFRPGKVPLSIVKKLYGEAIGYAVASDSVQKTYEAEVLDGDEHEVLGQPVMTALDYAFEGDLHAVIRFGVRPTFELQDFAGAQLSRLVYEVTDEEVDEEIKRLQEREADVVPIEEPAGEEDLVVADLQRVDEESGTPLIGEKQEDAEFWLSNEGIEEPMKQALLGTKAGDTARVTLTHDHGDHSHTNTFEVTVKDVKRRELPELDEEFVKQVTKDRFDNLDDFKAELKTQLQEGWTQRSREMVEADAVDRMVEMNNLPVPPSVTDIYLDSFVKDLANYVGGELPEGFDEAGFRDSRRAEAEKQGRWMFIRDKLMEMHDLKVEDEDRLAFFEKQATEELPAETMMQYYQAMPNMVEQLDQRLLNEKVFDFLLEQFDVIDKDREAYDAEVEERRVQFEAEAAAKAAEEEAAAVEAATAEETAVEEETAAEEEKAEDAK